MGLEVECSRGWDQQLPCFQEMTYKKLTCLPSRNPKFGGADLAAWSCKVRYSRGILTADLRPKGGVLASCPLTPRQVCDQVYQFISEKWKHVETMKQRNRLKLTFLISSLLHPKVGPFLGYQCNVPHKISHPCGAFYLNMW